MNDYQRGFGATTSRTGAVAMDEGLRKYMLSVYNYMALGVAGIGITSLFVASQENLVYAIGATPLKWVVFAGILGLGWFSPKIAFSGSKPVAHGMFWLYAVLWGLLIAPMLWSFNQAGMSQEIYRAFFISAAVFAGMSLWGYTTKRDMSGLGPILMFGGIGLLIALIVNVFLASTMFSLLLSCGVVVYIVAVTAYETQMIKSLYREGGASNDGAAIFGAFALLGSFATLFIHILNILGIMGRD